MHIEMEKSLYFAWGKNVIHFFTFQTLLPGLPPAPAATDAGFPSAGSRLQKVFLFYIKTGETAAWQPAELTLPTIYLRSYREEARGNQSSSCSARLFFVDYTFLLHWPENH